MVRSSERNNGEENADRENVVRRILERQDSKQRKNETRKLDGVVKRVLVAKSLGTQLLE
jgi:hypothetical protein